MSNGNNETATQQIQPASKSETRISVTDEGQFANLMDSGRSAQLWRMAQTFAASGLIPQHFQQNAPNCFIAMQMAMRMNVDPFMFMQNTYIVYGRPGMEAKLAIALINSSGLFSESLDYEISGADPKKPDYKVRAFAPRKTTGKVVYGPWVDWDLVKAEEWHSKKGSKWMTMPSLMFQYRAATFFGRLHCPERLMGMQTLDELRDTGEFPADRNVASVGAESKASQLLRKVTSKTVEPPDIGGQPPTDASTGEENNDWIRDGPEHGVMNDTNPASDPTPQATAISPLEEFRIKLGESADAIGVDNAATAKWWSGYLLAKRKVGKEDQLTPAELAEALKAFAAEHKR